MLGLPTLKRWLRDLCALKKTAPIRRKPERTLLLLEWLEDRITPSGSDLLYQAIDAMPLTLRLAEGMVQIVNTQNPQSVLKSQDFNLTSSVHITGNGQNVTLTIDVTMPQLSGGIFFDGTGSD